MSKSSRIIELVGPPGSGKTTLTKMFQQRNADLDITIFPYFREVSQIPFFAKSLVSFSPTLLHFYKNGGSQRITKRDIALMTILNKWNEVLVHQSAKYGKTIVLEEGAICLLAKLSAFGSELLKSEVSAVWWKDMYRKWARTINLVVQLDTPIPNLLKRIRARESQYEIETMSDAKAIEYLTCIQESQEKVLSHLAAESNGPGLYRFSTLECSPEQIYTDIVKVLYPTSDKYLI
jgi:thymidylate kinase